MKFRELVSYSEDEKDCWELSDGVFTFIIFAVWIVILNLLAIIYITKSKYIYFWDNATYWDISKHIASGIPDAFKNLYQSIGNMDYNYVAGFLPAFVMKIFGNSRLAYVLALVNLYLVPSMLFIYLIAVKIGKTPIFTMSIVMLICPAITFMAFIGFADVGGLAGALACFWLYFEKNNTRPALWKYVIIGILLVFEMLWRRWYAFFAVSFITAMIADCIINKKNIFPAFIPAIVAGIVLVLLFRDFLMNILLRDYGNLYSGYKFSAATDLKLITRYFGILYIIILAASTVYIAVKKHDLRPIFMWVQMIVCAFMFIMTQTHGQQHLLLYMPSLIVLTVYMIRYIDKEWMLAVICLLAVFDSVNVYIPYKQPQSIHEIKIYAPLPSFSLLPREREDTYEILRIKNRLDGIVGNGEKLGVLASSFSMNEDILRNVEASLGIKSKREDYIETLPQVDSRDSDIYAYGRVNYILLALPAQLHLGEDSQKIVSEAAVSFAEWTDIASAYEEVYEFNTSLGDMELKLFRRVRDVPDYDYKAFMMRYEKSKKSS